MHRLEVRVILEMGLAAERHSVSDPHREIPRACFFSMPHRESIGKGSFAFFEVPPPLPMFKIRF